MAQAEEAFVQHVQQLDDTRLLADVDEADVALLSSAPVYVFVYIAGRIRGAVLVVLTWYRLEGGKLDNTMAPDVLELALVRAGLFKFETVRTCTARVRTRNVRYTRAREPRL